MALMNNWDLNADNNSIYETDGKREYLVSDVATFGKTGNYFTRSKSRLRDYERSKFIERETPQYVDFVMHTRPFVSDVFQDSLLRRSQEMVEHHEADSA